MPKLSHLELKAILQAEKADALASVLSSKLTTERAKALDYYQGDMSSDMPDVEGRSAAVSTDVADTIEGLMPSLMEIFCGNEEVIKFDPVGPEDVQAAEQESDYVNHVFMQLNDGFQILYSFIKDALLSKLGVVKVWTEDEEKDTRETYLDQPEDTYALLVADPEVEVVEHTEHESPLGPLHDVTVSRKVTNKRHRVMPVPPEEFGISRRARKIKDAHYAFHQIITTQGEMLELGYQRKQVEQLQTFTSYGNQETLSRDTVNEQTEHQGDSSINRANRPIRKVEHYLFMDYEQNDKPRMYRVTTAGEETAVLIRNGEDEIIEVDDIPFAVMTPFPITHRLVGRSIADLTMPTQRIKTALTRALLDNAYLANNPTTELPLAACGPNTIDDLLIKRPGGIVRTATGGMLNPIITPPIGGHVFPMLQYFDQEREWRTGVSRAGQGLEADALQNQSATAANQVFNAAQAKTKLIARIFAETGIKDLFWLLHAEIRKNGDKPQVVRLRNTWVTVDPREWKTRNDMTVHVGLGDGGKNEQLARMMQLANVQKELLLNGMGMMVTPKNLFNTCKDISKLLERKNVDDYFTDPGDNPPPAPPPNPEMMKAQLEQAKAQAQHEMDQSQAQQQMAVEQQKAQMEMQLAQQRFELDKQLAILQYELKSKESQHKLLMDSAKAASATGPDGKQSNPGLTDALMQHLKKPTAPKRKKVTKVAPNEWVSEAL